MGQRHTLSRSKLNDVTNRDANGPTHILIESYGQGETAATIQRCDKEPIVLLSFLDTFVDLKELKFKDEQLRDRLLENQAEIERLQLDLNSIPEIEKAKQIADQQVATLKSQNAREVVELEQKLATERHFRNELNKKLTALQKSISLGLTSDDLRTFTEGMDGTTLAVGKSEFETVHKLVLGFASEVQTTSQGLITKSTEVAGQITTQLKLWATKEQETQQRIEELRRDLEKQRIKLDIAFIRKVTQDPADHHQASRS